MLRWAMRIVGGLLLLALMVSVPILWVEGMCATSPSASVRRPAPLVDDRGYLRRESDSYLSFPEWHIVYAYEDLAGVLRRGQSQRLRVRTADRRLLEQPLHAHARGDRAGEGGHRHQGDALHDRVELHDRARPQGRLREHHRAAVRVAAGRAADGGRHLRRARHAGLRGVPAPDALVPVPVRVPAGRLLARARRGAASTGRASSSAGSA